MDQRSKTQFAVLGFLSGGPKSGYDIKKSVEGSTSNFWQESFGQIYPILKRLTAEGLAERIEAPRTDGRERHVYAVTAEGRQALRSWIEEPTSAGPMRNELLLKTFFGRRAGPAVIRRQIEEYIIRQQSELAHLMEIRDGLASCSSEPDYPYWIMTIEYGELGRQAGIEWATRTLGKLKRLEAVPSAAGPTRTRKVAKSKKQQQATARQQGGRA